MTDTFDLYHDIQIASPSRPKLFDRSYILVEVAVTAERARQAIGYVAVAHGADGPTNTLDGRPVANPFDPAYAARVQARAEKERLVAAAVGDVTGLTAHQRKRRRQNIRKSITAFASL